VDFGDAAGRSPGVFFGEKIKKTVRSVGFGPHWDTGCEKKSAGDGSRNCAGKGERKGNLVGKSCPTTWQGCNLSKKNLVRGENGVLGKEGVLKTLPCSSPESVCRISLKGGGEKKIEKNKAKKHWSFATIPLGNQREL